MAVKVVWIIGPAGAAMRPTLGEAGQARRLALTYIILKNAVTYLFTENDTEDTENDVCSPFG